MEPPRCGRLSLFFAYRAAVRRRGVWGEKGARNEKLLTRKFYSDPAETAVFSGRGSFPARPRRGPFVLFGGLAPRKGFGLLVSLG